MRSVTPLPEVYPGETGDKVTCDVCGETVDLVDAMAERTDAITEQTHRVHRACTDEGVRRWNRENRPTDTPLQADRTGWNWSSSI